MEVIRSFTIDHSSLYPGIYLSRQDVDFDTFDIRMTAPNREPAVSPSAMHSLEHLMATWMRNREGVKQDVVYVGPMGCLTGMYIIMRKGYSIQRMRELMIECMRWISEEVTEVPATTPKTCGNCCLHDLRMAQWEAARYRQRLVDDFHSEYSPLEVFLEDGRKFQDA